MLHLVDLSSLENQHHTRLLYKFTDRLPGKRDFTEHSSTALTGRVGGASKVGHPSQCVTQLHLNTENRKHVPAIFKRDQPCSECRLPAYEICHDKNKVEQELL